jgi:structural maintenance of chromosome 1
MQLISIELENFKSFGESPTETQDDAQKSHIIGPFTNFTGIIGPNGTGKSNIFDAIAFALNLNMASGKSRHIKDLAHIPKQVSGEQTETSSK